MHLTPVTAIDKIGLATVLDRLADCVVGEPARAMVRGLSPSSERTHTESKLRVAEEFQSCLRFDDPLPFKPVDKLDFIAQKSRPEGAALDVSDFLQVRETARISRLVGDYFRKRSKTYPFISSTLSDLTPEKQLETAIDAVYNEDGQLRDSASPELRRVRREIEKTRDRLRSAIGSALKRAAEAGIAADEQPTIRAGRMVIPIRAEAKRKISGFIHDVSATGRTVYIEPALCLDLNNQIRELEVSEARVVESIRRALTKAIRDRLPALSRNADTLIRFEVHLGIGRLANDLEAVVPQLNDEGIVRITNGRNPELVLYFKDHDRTVVPLEIEIGDGFHTLVISGPNAGGKSVAMKTVGLMTAMLGLGIPVPVGPGSTFCLFDNIIVDIGDAQSVEDDLSTYTSHLRHLNIMLESADENTLVLIDEAGTGTDPDEGAALAQAVLEDLTKRRTRTIVTTHHGDLKMYAHEAAGTENGSMAFDMETLKPTFHFQLHTPGSSYAAEIAERVGIPESVVDRARELIGGGRVRVEALIASLEARNQALQKKLEEAEEAVRAAAGERDQLVRRMEALQSGRDEVKQRALEEADEILRAANARVERVIREIKESKAEGEITREGRALLQRARDDVRVENRKISRRQSSRRRKKSGSDSDKNRFIVGPIEEGDRVVLDGGKTVGVVLSMKASEALVAFESMQMRVESARLLKVGHDSDQQVFVRQTWQPTGVQKIRDRVDVRGQRVEEALSTVMTVIDAAVVANLNRLEIIHGKGTGALRAAIREYVEARPDVARSEEAPWNEGGPGVTIVWLNG